MHSARRVEGLLNRSRGKIPNLTKYTGPAETLMNLALGLTSMVMIYLFFREPRNEGSTPQDALQKLLHLPEHSPLLTAPLMLIFGLEVASGLLHIFGMASFTLTISYCIDVEMAGGTETDALYVPRPLAEVYKDMGGSESEREMAQLMADRARG